MESNESPAFRKSSRTKKRRFWRIALLIVLILLVMGVGVGVLWLQPYNASDQAKAELQGSKTVRLEENSEFIAFLPTVTSHTGLIFYPGAKVEPSAYAFLMHKIADQGYATFIVKMPLNLAIFGANRADSVIAAHPEITNWAIGGHSLGGVMASDYVSGHQNIQGLLLYASYPNNDISQRQGLAVTSLSGSMDGLATPEKVNAAKGKLPANTTYVVIEGGIHSFFGDYGHQNGDGQATISREQAQQQIIETSSILLQQIAAKTDLSSRMMAA